MNPRQPSVSKKSRTGKEKKHHSVANNCGRRPSGVRSNDKPTFVENRSAWPEKRLSSPDN